MPAAEVIFIAKYFYPKGAGFYSHQHAYYQMFLTTSGGAQMVLGDTVHEVEKNGVVLAKSGQDHALRPVAEGTVKLLDLKFVINDASLRDYVDALPGIIHYEESVLRDRLERIRAEIHQQKPFSKRIADNELESILYDLVRVVLKVDLPVDEVTYRLVWKSEYSGLAGQIADYVEANYKQDIDLETLARDLGYNRSYCCIVFRDGTGHTIGEYISRTRIRNAVTAIANTGDTFTQIAQDVGFKNIYHFSRVFKQVTGYTPSQVRELEREGLYRDRLATVYDPYRFEAGQGKAAKDGGA